MISKPSLACLRQLAIKTSILLRVEAFFHMSWTDKLPPDPIDTRLLPSRCSEDVLFISIGLVEPGTKSRLIITNIFKISNPDRHLNMLV